MAVLADDVRDRAFMRMYEGHVGDVYRYVLAVLRNPADAEDVTQTTFMNAYRAFKAGERPRKPQNWLITIAHNACRTRAVRASRRPREVPLDDVVEQLSVPEQDKPNVRELLAALGRLPFNQRAAITMRELEGRTYDEIAATLDVTVPAVEALLARARRTLRLQSSALRGLAVVQLPRSLRGMFETGDVATAGGALVGGGVLAKAAAVVVAGVVAGGVGKAVDAGVVHRSHSAPRPEPRAHHVEPAIASHGAPGQPLLAAKPHRAGAVTRHRTHHTAAPLPDPVVSVVSPGGATAPATPGGDPGAGGGSAPPDHGGQPAVPRPSLPPGLEPSHHPRGAEPPMAPVPPVAPVPAPVTPLLPQPPAVPPPPVPLPVVPPAPPVPAPVPSPAVPPVELPVPPPAVSPPAVPTVPAPRNLP
jgi:RNA polymerase sigma factor (sigma-70 family)